MTEITQSFISQKLNSKNFEDWYLFLKNYLIGKNLYQYSEHDIFGEKIITLSRILANLNAAQVQLDPENPYFKVVRK